MDKHEEEFLRQMEAQRSARFWGYLMLGGAFYIGYKIGRHSSLKSA